MEEEKKTRTVEQIGQEYQVLCTRAGHTQYQIDALSNDLDMMNEELRSLNLEAADIKGKEAAAKAATPEAVKDV